MLITELLLMRKQDGALQSHADVIINSYKNKKLRSNSLARHYVYCDYLNYDIMSNFHSSTTSILYGEVASYTCDSTKIVLSRQTQEHISINGSSRHN